MSNTYYDQHPKDLSSTGGVNAAASAPGAEQPTGRGFSFYLVQLLKHKWLILAIVLATLAYQLWLFYTTSSVYEAKATVQIEREPSAVELSGFSTTGLVSNNAPHAEYTILRSRTLNTRVVEELGLNIRTHPPHFPYIGKPRAQRVAGARQLMPALFGLDEYAWGGERIDVATFDLSDQLFGRRFGIRPHADGLYDFLAPGGQAIAVGTVGETLVAEYAGRRIELQIDNIVSRPGLVFGLEKVNAESVARNVATRIAVRETPSGSGILTIRYQENDPFIARATLDEVVTQYIAQNVDRKTENTDKTIAFIREQLPKIEEDIKSAARDLYEFQKSRASVALTAQSENVLREIVTLEGEKRALEQEVRELATYYTSRHPEILKREAELRTMGRQLRELRGFVDKLPNNEQELLRKRSNLEVKQGLYSQLARRLQELELVKAGAVGNIYVVDSARASNQPVAPSRDAYVLRGLGMGLLLGFGAALGLGMLNRRIIDPNEVERLTGVPVVSVIPHSSQQDRLTRLSKRAEQGAGNGESSGQTLRSSNVLAFAEPTDAAIEALRSLRASIHVRSMELPAKTILFTGPTEGIGKSFVSGNYAKLAADLGNSVLLIDGDMRRGTLHKQFGVPASPGLSEFLTGNVALNDVVRRHPELNLSFISRGGSSNIAGDLLMGKKFTELFADLKGQYDYVVIDSPPILPVVDAVTLAKLCDVTAFVVKSGLHPASEIQDAQKKLTNAHAAADFVVFNDVRREGVGKYYGYYGYGSYKYYRYGKA